MNLVWWDGDGKFLDLQGDDSNTLESIITVGWVDGIKDGTSLDFGYDISRPGGVLGGTEMWVRVKGGWIL